MRKYYKSRLNVNLPLSVMETREIPNRCCTAFPHPLIPNCLDASRQTRKLNTHVCTYTFYKLYSMWLKISSFTLVPLPGMTNSSIDARQHVHTEYNNMHTSVNQTDQYLDRFAVLDFEPLVVRSALDHYIPWQFSNLDRAEWSGEIPWWSTVQLPLSRCNSSSPSITIA